MNKKDEAKKSKTIFVSNEEVKESKIRKNIKDLLTDIDSKKYDLYLLINKVHTEETYLKWGFETFQDYIESDLNIPYRVGLWYSQIGEMVTKLKISRETVLTVTWTKLKEIATVMGDITPQELKEMIDKARNMTFREVQQEVKKHKKKIRKDESHEVEITQLSVNLMEDQADVVLSAIAKAKEMLNSDSTASALELICQEWLLSKG